MTKLLPFLLLLSSFALQAEETLTDLNVTKIWNHSQKELTSQLDLEPYQAQKQYTLLKKKEPITIAGYPFTMLTKFPKDKGLSELTFSMIAPKNALRKTCLAIHEYLSKTYGKENHQNPRIESVGESDKSFNMTYAWHNQNGSFEQSCFADKEENIIKITLYPKWELFECVMQSASNQHGQKYYFYIDEANQKMRSFEKRKLEPPFAITVTDEEITFGNQAQSFQGKMTKPTNRLSMKMITPNGQIKILQGFCYKRDRL